MKHPRVEMYTYTSTSDMLIWHMDIIYVSLFPLMSWCRWSFGELPPPQWIKGSRIFPGSSQGNFTPLLPSSSETLLSHKTQGIMLSTLSRELPADREDAPSLRLRVYLYFPSGQFLLTWHKKRSLLCPVHHQTEVSWGKPRMVHWAWSSPGYWMQCTWFPIALKANSKIPLRNCSPCFSLSSSLIRHEFPIRCSNQRHSQNGLDKVGFIKYSKSEIRVKGAIETFLREPELWCQMQDLESNSCLADPLSLFVDQK